MVKVIVRMPRRKDMSREDFQQYLRQTHLPLAAKVPGLRRLVVNWVLPDPKLPPPGYDAVVEDWFDDGVSMDTALALPELQAVVADEPNYLDTSRAMVLMVEEETVPLPTGPAASPAG